MWVTRLRDPHEWFTIRRKSKPHYGTPLAVEDVYSRDHLADAGDLELHTDPI